MDKQQKRILQKFRTTSLGLTLAVLTGGLFALTATAAGMGHVSVSFWDVLRIMGSAAAGMPELAEGIDPVSQAVLMDVRLPRILVAALVGGSLGVSGAVYQGILLNPLADPYTLGVSAGAAFGASLALLINPELFGIFSVPVFAFVGALATLMTVMYLAASAGGFSSNNLILSGIIVAAILSAGISFLKYVADERVSVIIFWLMGSLASKTWTDVSLVAAVACIGTGVCLMFARDLNLMSLGTRTAISMGTDVHKLSPVLLLCVSLMAAVCVSISGIVGFVGLLVPHLVRSICGPDHRRMIPISFLSGAILLLAADTVTRALLPSELPIGVLTALIGGPFFCWIFRRRQVGAMGHGF